MKKYQNYPYKLADVLDIYELGGMTENMNIVHDQLDSEGFQALKELLLVAKAVTDKDNFDRGYAEGHEDGYAEGYDVAHYHNYRDGEDD